jgi:hypothetical protein
MPKKRIPGGRAIAVVAAVAFLTLALAGTAQAKLVGEYTKFQYCPYKTAGVDRCLWSNNTGGEVVLGKKVVKIEKAVVLQGGYTLPAEEGPEANYSKFVAATNGETLTKAQQNVPGGLLGIVPDASSPFLVKALIKFFLENALTGVNSTLELAKPASEIRINELNLALGEGIVLKLPVKVHLENPFLGKSCFVGSSTSPINWNLRTDTTSPPLPNKPITGKPGELEFLEKGRILKINNLELVDNAWSAPAASGCGGIISFLVNPIINGQVGLPAAAGTNTAKLQNVIYEATTAAVNDNDVLNP